MIRAQLMAGHFYLTLKVQNEKPQTVPEGTWPLNAAGNQPNFPRNSSKHQPTKKIHSSKTVVVTDRP